MIEEKLNVVIDAIGTLTAEVRNVKTDLVGVNKCLDKIEFRLDGVDKRLDKMDQRFEEVDKHFEIVGSHFNQIDQRFDRLDEKVDNLAIESRSYFKHLENKTDLHQKVLIELASAK